MTQKVTGIILIHEGLVLPVTEMKILKMLLLTETWLKPEKVRLNLSHYSDHMSSLKPSLKNTIYPSFIGCLGLILIRLLNFAAEKAIMVALRWRSSRLDTTHCTYSLVCVHGTRSGQWTSLCEQLQLQKSQNDSNEVKIIWNPVI